MTDPKQPEAEEVLEGIEVEEPELLEPLALAPKAQPGLAVAPQVQAIELKERLDMIRELRKTSMIEGVHYGKVPGTDKDTLFKPGSEELGVLFRLDVQPENEKRWEEDGHLTVISKATVYDAPTGTRIGSGEGICSTRERKYAYRRKDLRCPECGQETLLKSKKDPEFFCWKKKGGCGSTFPLTDERITRQEIGEKDNPDLPDLWNTIDKMASKRARVDAVLAVTGASAIFTQDLAEEGEATEPTPSLPEATPEQNKAFSQALMVLMPEAAARDLYGQLRASTGGTLYGAVTDAVCVVVRAHQEIKEAESDERAGQKQAEGEASGG